MAEPRPVPRHFHGVSSRAAAAFYNATITAHGLITEEDKHLVADKCKINRAKAEYRRR